MAEPVPVLRYATIDSTNLEAARLVAGGLQSSIWLRADEQTKGRGRSARRWHSKPGGLYATLVLATDADVQQAPHLGFVMSLAVHDVLARFIPSARLLLKWPNDCLVGGAKICGILAETCTTQPLRLALGCGINVDHAPENMPYPVTSLRQEGSSASVDEVFSLLQTSVANRLAQWKSGAGFDATRQDWLDRTVAIGTQLKVMNGLVEQHGVFSGLAQDGALMLRDIGGRLLTVYAGDVGLKDMKRQ